MKTLIVSWILFLVMTAYLFIPVIPVFEYLINKDYIAKNLCINKDKPKSCCKGRCYMMKQLQKANKNTEDTPKNTNSRVQLKDLNEFVVCKADSFSEEIGSYIYFVHYLFSYRKMAIAAIFIPPELYPLYS